VRTVQLLADFLSRAFGAAHGAATGRQEGERPWRRSIATVRVSLPRLRQAHLMVCFPLPTITSPGLLQSHRRSRPARDGGDDPHHQRQSHHHNDKRRRDDDDHRSRKRARSRSRSRDGDRRRDGERRHDRRRERSRSRDGGRHRGGDRGPFHVSLPGDDKGEVVARFGRITEYLTVEGGPVRRVLVFNGLRRSGNHLAIQWAISGLGDGEVRDPRIDHTRILLILRCHA
jgi:hypothetical protein